MWSEFEGSLTNNEILINQVVICNFFIEPLLLRKLLWKVGFLQFDPPVIINFESIMYKI